MSDMIQEGLQAIPRCGRRDTWPKVRTKSAEMIVRRGSSGKRRHSQRGMVAVEGTVGGHAGSHPLGGCLEDVRGRRSGEAPRRTRPPIASVAAVLRLLGRIGSIVVGAKRRDGIGEAGKGSRSAGSEHGQFP